MTASRMDYRLSGGARRDPAVEAWLRAQSAELGPIARKWLEVMREQGDDVRELIHDGWPVACVGDAPYGYVNAFTSHVNVGFFHGASLPDPAGLLVGTGKYMRHVKLRPGVALDTRALGRLIDEAYLDIRKRLAEG